jgi:hypothetical protein
MEKSKHGGKREGSGKKAKPYPVKQMGCRVPLAIFNECVKFCKEQSLIFDNKFKKQ